jgi:hypothetical protein
MCCLRITTVTDIDTITFITAQSYILLYLSDLSTYIISVYSSELELACSIDAYSSIAYSSTSVCNNNPSSTSIVAGRHRSSLRIRRFGGIPVPFSIVQNSGKFF